jgi:hypothetical protein
MTAMEPDLENALKNAAAAFQKRKAAYETARTNLNSLIFDAKEEDAGPSEIARATGFTREWVAKIITAEEKRRAQS